MGLFEGNDELLKVLETSAFPIAVYDCEGGKIRTLVVSDGLIKLQAPGCTRKKLLERFNGDMYGNVHPDDVERLLAAAREFSSQDGGRYDVIYREKLHGQEEYSFLHAYGYHHFAKNGHRYAIIFYDDITSAKTSIAVDEKLFDSALIDVFNDGSNDAVVLLSADKHEILLYNKAMKDLWRPVRPLDSGVSLEEYLLKEGESFDVSVDELIEKGETVAADREGNECVISASKIRWKDEDAILLRATTEGSRYYDALTGLPNLAYYRQRADRAFEIIRGRGEKPSVIYTDIIGMRRYNDNLGFEAGDDLLKAAAALLKKAFPESWIFRTTADHFLVVTGKKDLYDRLASVNEDIKAASLDGSAGLSVGVASPYINEDSDILTIYDHAKEACAAAGQTSRFKVLFFDHELERDIRLHEYVNSNIDKAVKEGWIKAYYQPVVRTVSKTLCGMEALARWDDPVYGFLGPASFVGALEASHQIHKLDQAMIESVCRDMRMGFDSGAHIVPVSFNLSRLDFISCDILGFIEGMVEKYKIPKSCIHIEITESTMAAENYIRNQVKRFRKAGFEVWMDDFGSGYSSLNVLKDYDFDALKIDMNFLSSMSDTSRTIIRSIISMAKEIGIETLAEGVETQEQFIFLRENGCQKAQGYFFGKPKPLLETLKDMEDRSITIEDEAMRQRYATFGKVDFMSGRPMAILVSEKQKYSIVYANKKFVKELNSVGVPDVSELEMRLNNLDLSARKRVLDLEKRMFEAEGRFVAKMPVHGIYVALESQKVFNDGEFHAYVLSISNTAISVVEEKNEEKVKSGKKARILVADDYEENRKLLGNMLEDDYDVLYAEDGVRALELLRQNADMIDVGLFDFVMPGMNGLEAVSIFRQEGYTGISFIMMVDPDDTIPKRSIELGAAAFIQKPLPAPVIVKAHIENALAAAEQLQASTLRYMESMPGGVFLYRNSEGSEVVYTNQKLLELFECETKEEFSELCGGSFKGAVAKGSYDLVKDTIDKQVKQSGGIAYLSYQIKTKKGRLIPVEHCARLVDDPKYGNVFVCLLFADSTALREYRARRSAFISFMAAGKATHPKSYDPGYKAYIYWNLTKDSPAIKVDGISYIPEELKGKYTYSAHVELLKKWMERDEDFQKAKDYDRDHLIQAFKEGRAIQPFSISYHIDDRWFSIRSTLMMMKDPSTEDIILRLQNENDTKAVVFERLVDAALGTVFYSLLYFNGSEDAALIVSNVNGHVQRREVTFSEFYKEIAPVLGLKMEAEEWVKLIESKLDADGRCSFRYTLSDGIEKRADV
ncbi:MAG: EAL domain-containing protein [Bacilli bacterium]|nr:EAL domain-containing protein [Bacilli bacterium]